jgi:peptidoglycan/LPS O-acetylase OafA/YrhL
MDGSPRAVSGRHLPALDGVRALAILGVMAYHLDLGWASGGYLGVDLFFVLSGFLITSLLLEESIASGRIRLAAFWGRRARRLLPALFLVLVAVSIYAVVNGRFSSPATGGAAIDLSGLRGDALATLLYVANWHAIFSHQSYFTQFSTPSPLQHTWSLAIEEQFYLLWPLVIFAVVTWGARRWRGIGLGLCVLGAGVSALLMALLYHPEVDPSRVYYGTDTRAFDLLAGAAVAFLAAGRPQPGDRARRWLHGAAPVAAVVLGVFWARAGTSGGLPTSGMFEGEFLLCAVLAAVVIADVRQLSPGPLATLLSLAPLRFIGTISYGLYLWHWPIFVYLNEARTGLSGAGLDLARIALTFVVSIASYRLVEQPIRRGSLSGLKSLVVVPSAVVLVVGIILVGTTPSFATPIRAWSQGGLDPGSGPGVPGAGGFGTEVPIALPPGVTVSPERPLRVLTFGDSVMSYAELGIRAALEATGEVRVFPAARPGWSLNEGNEAGLQGLVRGLRPELLIGTWSWDNPTAQHDPGKFQGELDSAIRAWLSPGDGVLGVVFLQMPAFGPGRHESSLTPGVPAWNDAVRAAASAFPGKVMYLPVGTALEIDGRFTSWLPPPTEPTAPLRHWVRIRTADGVHLCPPGITRYAAPVLQDMTQLFGLHSSVPRWWNSYLITVKSLSHEDSSVDLTCPDDHPTRRPIHAPPSVTRARGGPD